MKIDRLIGIISILLQNEKVTAPWLAERFEVSRRTISRDIEDICKAGIPIVTAQGYKGGISIAEGYKIDRSVFTEEEMRAVFMGLSGIDSISDTSYTKRLADKLGGDSICALADYIAIDLSTHYKDALTPKIAAIRKAIGSRNRIAFRYYYEKGEAERVVEPYLLVFRWASWYVFGYCLKREDFRMFKLNRVQNLNVLAEVYERREIPGKEPDFERCFESDKRMTLCFDPEVKYRIVEDYGLEAFREQEDGTLLFSFPYANEASTVRWILSFGGKAEVLAPEELREAVVREAEGILRQYRKKNK